MTANQSEDSGAPLAAESTTPGKPPFKRRLTLAIAPPILAVLIRLLSLTLRKRWINGEAVPDEPIILAFWHGELLLTPKAYYHLSDIPASGMISDHKDGEILSKTVERLSVGSIRGSSSKGGVKALINAIKCLRGGTTVAITPDGPRGPRHSWTGGLVKLAQKADAKIVVLTIVPHNTWRLRSWDQFFVPKPFSKVDFIFSDPISVTAMDETEANALVKATMMEKVLL